MRRDIRKLDGWLQDLAKKHQLTYYGLVILLVEIVLVPALLLKYGLDALAGIVR